MSRPDRLTTILIPNPYTTPYPTSSSSSYTLLFRHTPWRQQHDGQQQQSLQWQPRLLDTKLCPLRTRKGGRQNGGWGASK
ncbi:Hypothetical protein FKW44_021860 [Caligus rogercresseyi]|uniref:Uncharacterized protein n=1 Tax=Caligus rogercresseyi TaxID=217165 RepID=A0A7T8GRY9_CALRO|nr:Hypothetical protein FKW44_021860 [Caligus rogercresseyi]